jgi:hypothetical protein
VRLSNISLLAVAAREGRNDLASTFCFENPARVSEYPGFEFGIDQANQF